MRSSDFHEKNKVLTMAVIVLSVCADFPVLWFWSLAFCPPAFVLPDVYQLVRHGTDHKSREVSVVQLLWSDGPRLAFSFDLFFSFVAVFEPVKE